MPTESYQCMAPRPARKRIYIHIGYPKTGTTSIQVWLTGNADVLAAQGVLYPLAGRGTGDCRFGHHLFPGSLAQRPLGELANSWPDMDELRSEIAKASARTIILSSEDFATKLDRGAIDLLAHRLCDFDVRIICYVRRQDEFIISVWSTAVANYGEKNPLSDCLEHSWLDYERTLEPWAHAFGSGAISLRVYEETQLAGGDVLTDFLSVCDMDPPLACEPSARLRHNRRVPPHVALIQAYLNAQDVDGSVTAHLNALVGAIDCGNGRLQLLSSRDRATLLSRHAKGNSSLARTFLGRADGQLFTDMAIRDEDDASHASSLPRAIGLFIDDCCAALLSRHKSDFDADVEAAEGRLPSHNTEQAMRCSAELPTRFRELSDESWLSTLLGALTQPKVQGFRFPQYPAPAIQTQFVGSANEEAMREAFKFYILAKAYGVALGAPIGLETKLLDFGVGWGRFSRLFWKDVRGANLYGCDVDPDILMICEMTGVPGNFDRLYAWGRLPYPDHYLDGGIAYSVFTHLSEETHLHWVRELARVLRPGAVFCMTLQPRRFVDFMERMPGNPTSTWHSTLGEFAGHGDALREQFDQGCFIYLPTGGGAHRPATDYGEAIVPLSFIERAWTDKFTVRAYIDNPLEYNEAVVIVQRT